ncbi:MAG: NADP-dependent oxidoreductase [Actinobacteria bacterium]|nr:NADP-dependent oxidoreductase [Actinomycetota bacterium]
MSGSRERTGIRAMRAVRLHGSGSEALEVESIEMPTLAMGEALVRVLAAGITRDELGWPADRLPATPSYEVSGIVAAVAPDVEEPTVGEPVYGLTPFDCDGAAAEYVAVSARLLAPKPRELSHVESAALPLAGLSAWQGLFDHGALKDGQRVVVTGAAGGVGHLATQLALWRGAYVIAVTSPASAKAASLFGAHEVLVPGNGFGDTLEPADLVFDTVGGDLLRRLPTAVRPGGRLVSVAGEPPPVASGAGIDTRYFVVEPKREQLVELTRLVASGALRPAVDSVFALADAREAFDRSMAAGKRGKVVLLVSDE